MQPNTENKLILVVRRTRLDELLVRFNTLEQARFYVEHLGADFSDYQQEHQQYQQAQQTVLVMLQQLGRVQRLERQFLTNFQFGKHDTIVVLGQDGLVANTLKYLHEQPVIAVNPDPQRFDGVLLPFQINDVQHIVADTFAQRRDFKTVTMAQATLNNGQQLYAVNDLFIGPKSHTSARYQLQLGQHSEQQSSSGIIVSTGLGSTGWFKSLVAGAYGIVNGLQNKAVPEQAQQFAWDSEFLRFTVREPFPSVNSSASLVCGTIQPRKPLQLTSQMAENGVIFSDGIEQDYLEFNSGTQAVINLADKRGLLVI